MWSYIFITCTVGKVVCIEVPVDYVVVVTAFVVSVFFLYLYVIDWYHHLVTYEPVV